MTEKGMPLSLLLKKKKIKINEVNEISPVAV